MAALLQLLVVHGDTRRSALHRAARWVSTTERWCVCLHAGFGVFVCTAAGRAVLRAAAHMCGARRRSAPHGRWRAQSAVRCRSSCLRRSTHGGCSRCSTVLMVLHGIPRYSTVFHGTPRYSTVLTVLAALNQRAHCGGQHSTVRRLFSSHSSAMPSAAAAAADCVGLRTQYLHVRRHSGGLAWRATVTACSAAVRIVCSRPHWVGISTVRYTYGLLYVFGSDSSTVLSHYCIPQRFGMRWSVGNICRC